MGDRHGYDAVLRFSHGTVLNANPSFMDTCGIVAEGNRTICVPIIEVRLAIKLLSERLRFQVNLELGSDDVARRSTCTHMGHCTTVAHRPRKIDKFKTGFHAVELQ